MNLKERGKGLSHKQALAAIGQGRLIALWDNLFSQVDQPIAQILLTRMDISDVGFGFSCLLVYRKRKRERKKGRRFTEEKAAYR